MSLSKGENIKRHSGTESKLRNVINDPETSESWKEGERDHTSPAAIPMTCGVKPCPALPASHQNSMYTESIS